MHKYNFPKDDRHMVSYTSTVTNQCRKDQISKSSRAKQEAYQLNIYIYKVKRLSEQSPPLAAL